MHDIAVQATLAVLEQHDLDAAQSLSAVLKMPQQQYQELLHVEEQPSSVSRQAYVDQAVQRLLVHDVVWQHQALRQGFYTVVDRQVRMGSNEVICIMKVRRCTQQVCLAALKILHMHAST